MIDKVLKAKAKAAASSVEPVSPELAMEAHKATASRLRMRIEQLVVLLRRNTCPPEAAIDDVPLEGRVCLWCGKRECAQAREFLDANF